jgi:hypothetical protein
MALIILEGLDRTGKSSVASYFQDKGFELIHMSAPAKGTSPDAYMGEIVDMLTSFAGRDVVMDRSHYGELVWPTVYGRTPLLTEDDMEALREIEDSLQVNRILMQDPNSEAHWKRCVDNKEPLTKVQFIKARNLYSAMADKHGFNRKTLNDFPEAAQLAAQVAATSAPQPNSGTTHVDDSLSQTASGSSTRTPQQIKLDRANAINEVLSRRIIKGKGGVFDELERSVRGFLNTELGKLFGAQAPNKTEFSSEEVQLLKFFCERLKSKENE